MTVFLVGGGAGVGKTTVARALAARLGAGWLQLDSIWLALLEAAEPGSARRDLFDVDGAARSGVGDTDELLRRHIAAAEALEAVLPSVLAFEASAHPHLVVDGAWVTPAGAQRLAAHLPVRAAYLCETDPIALRRAMDARRADAHPRPWHDALSDLAWRYGRWLAQEAQRCAIPVVDARPFATQGERVRAALGLSETLG
jgi:hypothetical protein